MYVQRASEREEDAEGIYHSSEHNEKNILMMRLSSHSSRPTNIYTAHTPSITFSSRRLKIFSSHYKLFNLCVYIL